MSKEKQNVTDNHTELLQQISNGDRPAFARLYAETSARVYNTALAYLQNPADAEEVTQDVYTTVFWKAATFRGKSSVQTWLYRITVNTSLNFLKKRKRLAFLPFGKKEEKSDFEHPGVLMENKEAARKLFALIDALPDAQKTAFVLCYVEELPQQEAAEIMETSLKAVESLLQRGKKKLREQLQADYPLRRKK